MIEYRRQQIASLECVLAQDNLTTAPDLAVILCHGFGAPGTDLVSLAEALQSEKLQNAIFIFPQAPISLDPMFDSRAWWQIDMDALQRAMDQGEFREMEKEAPEDLPARSRQINDVIAWVRNEYSLESSQIVVGGFSQGSMLATDVALRAADPLAGLVIWSGALINAESWKAAAAAQKSLRIVQSHGRTDAILPFSGAEKLRDMLIGAGHSVDFVPFDGPHTISQTALEQCQKLLEECVS